VNLDAEREALQAQKRAEEAKRAEEFAKATKDHSFGSIEVGERRGMVVDPITGERKYTKNN
jgi:hypothetical protein